MVYLVDMTNQMGFTRTADIKWCHVNDLSNCSLWADLRWSAFDCRLQRKLLSWRLTLTYTSWGWARLQLDTRRLFQNSSKALKSWAGRMYHHPPYCCCLCFTEIISQSLKTFLYSFWVSWRCPVAEKSSPFTIVECKGGTRQGTNRKVLDVSRVIMLNPLRNLNPQLLLITYLAQPCDGATWWLLTLSNEIMYDHT